MNLEPPGEHQLLVFWVALLTLVVVARLLGSLMTRIGQPAVVGELGAGVLLGPSVLGRIAPGVTDWLFPADDSQTAMLFTVGWLGVMFLLISAGHETDLGLLRRLGRAAASVSSGSLVVPLIAGVAIGLAMPDVLRGNADDGLVFALFMGTALSISSLPVIAKILVEMRLLRRDFGQLTLAAAMANDVVGWILLGVIAGIATDGLEARTVVTTVAGVALFFALAFTVGQRLIDMGLRRARSGNGGTSAATGVILIAALAAGSMTQWLGVEAILGAFVVGILLGRSRFRHSEAVHQLESVTAALFAPVFFATAGLRVDLGLLGDPVIALWTVLVVVVASLSKFVGAFVGARAVGLARREGTALGLGLNARGALEIVIATVGLSLGVLNEASYAVVVVMAIATSMMAPPLLRATLRSWTGGDAERARLEREAVAASNRVVRSDPVLLPTTGGLKSVMAAQVVDLVWPVETSVTLMTVTDNGHVPDLAVIEGLFADRERHRVTATGGLAEAIVSEARLGHGAVVLGATSPVDGALFSPLVDTVIRSSEVPVVIVRRGSSLDTPLPWAFGRALVGVAGTRSSRAAQEIAFNLSATIGTEIVLAHVVHRPPAEEKAHRRGALGGQMMTAVMGRVDPDGVGRQLLDEAARRADGRGARSTSLLEQHRSPGPGLAELVDSQQADLVIVGASRRTGSDQLFLGHTVEDLLGRCDATVIIVVLPDGDGDGSKRQGE